MTAPDSKLVELVARAIISKWNAMSKMQSDDWEAYIPFAKAAIAACHAEIRSAAIEEVASKYHDALADFFDQKGYAEQLAGIAEKEHKTAKRHRTYAKEIREQVWAIDNALLAKLDGQA